MNKDFMQYVYSRCEVALQEDAAYMALSRNKTTEPAELEAKAEEICYLKGFQDAISLFNK